MEGDKRHQVCLEVLKQGYRRLYFELRFLEQALFRLSPEENERIYFGSDGEKLYYDGEYLLKRYLQAPEAVSCDYLHTVIHCLYQHPFQEYQWEREYWNLAADIAVADVLGEMDVPWILEQISRECLEITDQIKRALPIMSAFHIAAYLQNAFGKGERLFGYRYTELVQLFQRDNHVCWNSGQKETGREKEKSTDDEEKQEKRDGDGQGTVGPGEDIFEEGGGENEQKTGVQFQRLSEEWKETAESVVLNVSSFSKEQGKVPGSMLLAIKRLTREQYDYEEFLRKFAVINERMKVNMDEFDYSYYMYGLRVLGKIPLIEPLEYKEEKQIREFVIVIDTSGSCGEELVGRFLNKTYNILCQMECFADQIVLHIIQCDAEVQEDVRIKSLIHMEEYIMGIKLKGGGGTDFRPAFDYVEKLRENGEFKRLCGLIYFTDGYGTFPGRPPDYKTAFVFVERDDEVRVPPWAMRIYLERV